LKCSLFHNSNLFGVCIIHILYTEYAKIKKNNSGPKRLKKSSAGTETEQQGMLGRFVVTRWTDVVGSVGDVMGGVAAKIRKWPNGI
jgi:hypothetical protein